MSAKRSAIRWLIRLGEGDRCHTLTRVIGPLWVTLAADVNKLVDAANNSLMHGTR